MVNPFKKKDNSIVSKDIEKDETILSYISVIKSATEKGLLIWYPGHHWGQFFTDSLDVTLFLDVYFPHKSLEPIIDSCSTYNDELEDLYQSVLQVVALNTNQEKNKMLVKLNELKGVLNDKSV